MAKIRRNLFFPAQQWERFIARSKLENVPIAELVQSAVDAYLEWNDPTYTPPSHAPNKERPFILRLKDGGFLARIL